MTFSLSRTAREATEAALTTEEALARFQDKARTIAQSARMSGLYAGSDHRARRGSRPPADRLSGVCHGHGGRFRRRSGPYRGRKSTVTIQVAGTVVLWARKVGPCPLVARESRDKKMRRQRNARSSPRWVRQAGWRR
jgi:hypothetical protein